MKRKYDVPAEHDPRMRLTLRDMPTYRPENWEMGQPLVFAKLSKMSTEQ